MVLAIQQTGQKPPELFAEDWDGPMCPRMTYHWRSGKTWRVRDRGGGRLSSQRICFSTKGKSNDIGLAMFSWLNRDFPNMWVTCVVVTPSSRGQSFKRHGLLYIALMLHSGRKHLNFYGFPAVTNFPPTVRICFMQSKASSFHFPLTNGNR